jgi:hypothetical protein
MLIECKECHNVLELIDNPCSKKLPELTSTLAVTDITLMVEVGLASLGMLWLVKQTLQQGDQIGEFSTNGRLFTLGNFLKITEGAHIFVLIFPYVLIMYQL